MQRPSRLLFIIYSASISLSFSLCCCLKGFPILPEGPAVAVAETAKSLWNAGSISPAYLEQTYNEVVQYSKGKPTPVFQDVFALDKSGKLRPKHSPISSLMVAPFYGFFGELGFWIFQQLCFLTLLLAIYTIIGDLTRQKLLWTTIVSACVLTQTILYSYSFSYDLHGTTLLIGGLSLMRHSRLLSGFIMGLSLFVRPAYLILLVPLSFARVSSWKSKEPFSAQLGVAAALILFMLLNYSLWGSPFLTAYASLPHFVDGLPVSSAHPYGLDLQTFLNAWPAKLFGGKGLLPYNLSIVALPLVLLSLKKHKERRYCFICLASALAYSLYIFSYPMWFETSNGNRFLLPAIILYLISFVIVMGRLEVNLQGSRTKILKPRSPN